MVRKATKTDEERLVSIGRALADRLRGLRLQGGTIRLSNQFVFAMDRGTPMRRSGLLRRRWHPLLAHLDLDRCGFHRMRHTFASIALSRGVDIVTVSEALGHANPSITLSIYSHLIEGNKSAPSAAIEAALVGAAGV